MTVNFGDKMHPLRKTQIAHLKADKALIKVSSKYAYFVDIFLLKLAAELSKYMRINDYAIKLIDDWQPLYNFIYNLGLVKLEILKTNIENNLANSFIRSLKFLVGAHIFFNKKPDSSLRLYVDYQGLNKLTFKNWYLLSLVCKLLDFLSWVWYFT